MIEDDEKMEEVEEEESFAELFEGSIVKRVAFEPGQKIKARIVKASDEFVFIDLGGKSEGYLDSKELRDDEGNLSVKEGDLVEAYFLSEANNELRFTTRISGGDVARHHLEEAWRSGIPLEGLVEKEIKGGFEVKIAGGLRGFCPFSQMGLQRVQNPADFVDRHLSFRITQFAERGRNIILSNRSVLEEELRRQREELRATLQEGMKVRGTISSIRNFGAFVRIGVVEGLIPISEMAWDRVEEVGDVLEVGQEVEVIAMKLDWEKDRLSFSLKQALPDPWENADTAFPVGSQHSGTVARLTNFGAFVNIASGIDGLIHISKLGAGKRINHPREVLTKGQTVEVRIESVDKENKRLSLSLVGSEKVDEEKESGEDYSRYIKEKPGSMGTLADLMKAKLAGGKKGGKK
jgi:small subunit ribosomal protein S1